MKILYILSSWSNLPIGVIVNNSIIEADRAIEFSISIIKLLEDNKKREHIAANGYSFVKENFTWQRQTELLKKLIAS